MKIVFIGFLTHGDHFPLIGLAKILRNRGHKIAFFAPAPYRQTLINADIEFLELFNENEYQQALADPDLWRRDYALHVLQPWLILSTERVYNYFNQLDTHKNLIIIAHYSAFGARLVNEALNIPTIMVFNAPGLFISNQQRERYCFANWLMQSPSWFYRCFRKIVLTYGINRIFKNEINQMRSDIGLKPLRHFYPDWIYQADMLLGLFPEWLTPKPDDWPKNLQVTEFPLFDNYQPELIPEDVIAFISDDKPIVYTPGSAVVEAEFLCKMMINVSEVLKKKLIILAPHAQLNQIEIPEHVSKYAFIPMTWLLPKCSVFIHHGGIGACAVALQAGVAQLAIPLILEQFDTSFRMCRLGVGDEMNINRLNKKELEQKLRNLLESESIKKQTEIIANKFNKHNNMELTCELVEDFINKLKP